MILLPHFLPFLMFPVNDLNICILPKCICWNPTPVWWYLEIGPLGGHEGQMRSWGWSPREGFCSPLRRDTWAFLSTLSPSPPHLHVRAQQEGSCLRARNWALTRNQPCQHPDIRPPAPELWANKCMLVVPPAKPMAFCCDSSSRQVLSVSQTAACPSFIRIIRA